MKEIRPGRILPDGGLPYEENDQTESIQSLTEKIQLIRLESATRATILTIDPRTNQEWSAQRRETPVRHKQEMAQRGCSLLAESLWKE